MYRRRISVTSVPQIKGELKTYLKVRSTQTMIMRPAIIIEATKIKALVVQDDTLSSQ
jgi:hypothetical protein